MGHPEPSLGPANGSSLDDSPLSDRGRASEPQRGQSTARRVSGGPVLGLVNAWSEMPVVEEDKEGGKRRTNRAWKE